MLNLCFEKYQVEHNGLALQAAGDLQGDFDVVGVAKTN